MLVLFPVMLQAQKNSQWRGENRDGIYNETGLLKEWPAGGPEMLWKYEGLGEGFTSVAIANGKIYVTGISDDNLILYVLDFKGQQLNKKVVGKEWTTNHVGTRCTVNVNDGKLYIGNSLGQIFCLDEATLNEVWKKDMIADFGGRNIRWGMTESPLIVGDKIFLTPGGEQHNMIALNKNTGALIWSSPGQGRLSAYCSPQFISGYSIPIIVTCTQQEIAAFHADTGEFLWSHPQPSTNTIHPNTPLYHNGMIFSITGYSGGAWLYRLTNGGRAAELVWHNKEMDNMMGGAVKIGDYVYASGDRSRSFFCVDWKTGENKYRVNDLAPCITIFADGMLYCYSEAREGTMALVKPNPEKFEMVSSFQVTLGTGRHWAHPVIHQGVLYLRHGDVLMAYKIK